LIFFNDDGSVVEAVRECEGAAVSIGRVGVALRQRLGDDGAHELAEYVGHQGDAWRKDVMTTCTDRIDVRLERFALREDFIKGFSGIREEMAALRVELLRWSFAFWIGQVAATAGLMALLIRFLVP
jgi:hypothetical protein